jgi:hypothetical protein
VGSGQWAVGSGQWAVGSGQWAVGSGVETPFPILHFFLNLPNLANFGYFG